MELQIKLVVVTYVNDNIASERTRNGIHRFLTDGPKCQRCAFELICLVCS